MKLQEAKKRNPEAIIKELYTPIMQAYNMIQDLKKVVGLNTNPQFDRYLNEVESSLYKAVNSLGGMKSFMPAKRK